jgi:hypothetical protein
MDDTERRRGLARDVRLLVVTTVVFLVLFAGAVLTWLLGR